MPGERLGDVLGGDEDAVGELQVAEPPVVEPGEFLAVECAVAEVDPEEVGGGLHLALEDDLLLADVPMDHAQDRGDAELPTEWQSIL